MPRKSFRCKFCNQEFHSLGDANTHEKNCVYNPIHKTCYTCQYLDLDTHMYMLGRSYKCAEDFHPFSYGFCKSWKLKKDGVN